MFMPVKFHRLSKGMKLYHLAKKANVSISLLSKIENGVTPGSKETRKKISQILGLPERVLFGER